MNASVAPRIYNILFIDLTYATTTCVF